MLLFAFHSNRSDIAIADSSHLHTGGDRAICDVAESRLPTIVNGFATSFAIGPAGLPALSVLGSSNSHADFHPVALVVSLKRGLGIVLNVEPSEV